MDDKKTIQKILKKILTTDNDSYGTYIGVHSLVILTEWNRFKATSILKKIKKLLKSQILLI